MVTNAPLYVPSILPRKLTDRTTLLSERSPSWDAKISPTIQEIPHISCNQTVHYRVHNSPPHIPNLSQINPVHTLATYLISIAILSSRLRLDLASDLIPSIFPPHLRVVKTALPVTHGVLMILDLLANSEWNGISYSSEKFAKWG